MDEASVWLSLLHVNKNISYITDENFLLTSTHFSPAAELDATIEAFHGEHQQTYLCRFPARYFWLKQYISLPELDYGKCEDLHTFATKAPADKISAIYVSENITQPSSMMGHLFLKISGVNSDGKNVEHAISFYTETKTFNIPKLMYESLIKGKKGFFSLSPFSEKVENYVRTEQRNLWTMDLQLSQEQKRLIQLHLYELKQTELTYFFQKYNCATVSSFVLSLAIPELRNASELWLTPLDVAKKINTSGAVAITTIQPSSRWQLRMLQTQTSKSTITDIKKTVALELPFILADEPEKNQFFRMQMAESYNNYLMETSQIDKNQWSQTHEKILPYESLLTQYSINLSEYKNPLQTSPDSQLWIGATHQNQNWYLQTGLLPASHSLEDDNRQYFGETGLHLAHLSLLTNIHTGRTQLNKFELYAAESFIPFDKLTGGISGRFAIGVAPSYNQQLIAEQQAFIKGALGYTYALTNDVDVYGIAGLGLGYSGEHPYLYTSPEIGAIVREIYDMKSIVSITRSYGELDNRRPLDEVKFTQAKYINKNYSVFLRAKRTIANDKHVDSVELILKNYF